MTAIMSSTRGGISLLLWFGLLTAYMHRAIASVAIIPLGSAFGYDAPTRGLVLSSFFWGYIATGMLGGWAATRWGGWPVLLVGMLGSTAATLACVATAGWLPGLLAARTAVGLAQGLIYPSIHALASQWAPRSERATLVGFVWSGGFLGPALTLPLAGALVSGSLSLPGLGSGWRACFTASGAAGALWCAAWARLGASSPARHALIDPAERAYITASQDLSRPVSMAAVPWRRVLSHPAVAGLVLAHTTHNYMLYMLLSWIPTYLHDVLGYDLHDAGLVAVAPYLACFVISVAAGLAGDAAIRGGTPALTVRRAAMTLSEVVPAAALLAAGFVRSPPAAVGLLTLAVGLSGACSAGFASNHLDIAPQYAGLLYGLSNTVATLPGIIAPVVVGALVAPPHDDIAHWRMAFGIAAAINMLGWAAFMLLARATQQKELDAEGDINDSGDEEPQAAGATSGGAGGAAVGTAALRRASAGANSGAGATVNNARSGAATAAETTQEEGPAQGDGRGADAEERRLLV